MRFKRLVEFFGEDPTSTQPEGFFALFNKFCQLFVVGSPPNVYLCALLPELSLSLS
jgi:hypothetical protein